MTKTIGFLMPTLNIGGAERQLFSLAVALNKQFVVTVFTYAPQGAFTNFLQKEKVKIVYLTRSDLSHLIEQLDAEKIDCLLTFPPGLFIHIAPLKTIKPALKIIWAIRVDPDTRTWPHEYTAETKEQFFQAMQLMHYADGIVTNTEKGYHYLTAYNKTPVKYINNGLNYRAFYISPVHRKIVRAQWGIEDNECVIGRVGRLCPGTKNHPLFLQAAAQLIHQGRKVKFFIIGTGDDWYKQQLQQVAVQLNIDQHVYFIETGLELCALYNALDISCSTSDTEGTPNVVIESMACGVPCVVTDVGASKLIVGHLGRVVPKQDLSALVAALSQTIDDLPKLSTMEYKITRRVHMLTQYSFERCVTEHVDFIESLV